ncbi:hypothetical protein ACVW00_001233 [Marmoricola sp. URHA0025 HA25]
MNNPTGRRIGLVLFGLLSVADTAGILLTDGDHPPYAVAALGTLLGLASLVLVVQAFRDPSRSLRLLIGLRVLSAVTAIPAFFVSDVPAGAQAAAGTIVLLTAVAVLLTARTRTEAVA